jgi:hypothetical protein
VIESEKFFTEPETVYGGLLDFLGLAPVFPERFERWNGRPSAPMPGATRARLLEHFARHDRSLAALLGRDPAWMH